MQCIQSPPRKRNEQSFRSYPGHKLPVCEICSSFDRVSWLANADALRPAGVEVNVVGNGLLTASGLRPGPIEKFSAKVMDCWNRNLHKPAEEAKRLQGLALTRRNASTNICPHQICSVCPWLALDNMSCPFCLAPPVLALSWDGVNQIQIERPMLKSVETIDACSGIQK